MNYEVTGTLSPDVTGTYVEGAVINGKVSYVRDANCKIVWELGKTGGAWIIAIIYFDESDPPLLVTSNWQGPATENPEGEYTPRLMATGTATVTAAGSVADSYVNVRVVAASHQLLDSVDVIARSPIDRLNITREIG